MPFQDGLESPAFRVDRARVLARMAQVKPEPQRSWYGYAALAAAGVAVLVVGARLWLHPASTDASASLEVTVSQGSATQLDGASQAAVASNQSTRIQAKGELDTAADSKANLRTSDGLQIELQSQTRVALAELKPSSSQVRLLGGAIRCSIPHRNAQHAFQVLTADATVVDLGTVFTVSVEGPNHTTVVSVEEGEVMVQHGATQTRVQAPSTWSSAEVSALPAPQAVPAPSAAEPEPSAKPTHASLKPAPTPTLGLEAQLLRQGLAAERQGHSAEAAAALSQLLKKYPHSPLAPDARAALARVEAGTQP